MLKSFYTSDRLPTLSQWATLLTFALTIIGAITVFFSDWAVDRVSTSQLKTEVALLNTQVKALVRISRYQSDILEYAILSDSNLIKKLPSRLRDAKPEYIAKIRREFAWIDSSRYACTVWVIDNTSFGYLVDTTKQIGDSSKRIRQHH